MKKFFKRIGVLTIILFLLLLAACIALYIAFPPEKIIQMSKDQIKETTGREATIGSATIKIWGGFGFKLRDFSIADPDGFPDRGKTIKLSGLNINANPIKLLKKELAITKILLIDPDIRLIVQPDSSNNFTFSGGGADTEETVESSKEGETLPISFSIPLHVQNGSLTYIDQTANQTIRLEKITSEITARADKDRQDLEVSMDLTIPEGEMTKADQPMLPLSLFPLQANVEAQVSLGGQEQSYDLKRFDLVLDKLSLHTASNGAWTKNSVNIESFTIKSGKTQLSAAVKLDDLDKVVGAYHLTLESDLADLSPSMDLGVESIIGQLAADFRGNIEPDAAGQNDISAMLPQGSLSLKSAAVKINNKTPRIEQISGTLLLENRHFSIKGLQAKIGNSKIVLQLFSDLSGLKTVEDWKNLIVNYSVIGDVDLAEIKRQAPPDFLLSSLSGNIRLDLSDSVDLGRDTEDYSRLIPTGSLTLAGVKAAGDSIPEINRLEAKIVTEADATVTLKNFTAQLNDVNDISLSARSDLSSFKKAEDWEKITVNFALNSKKLDLNTLLPPSDPNEPVVMPEFPKITIHGDAQIEQLIFQEYDMRRVKATIELKDQVFSLKNYDMDIFGGHLNLKMAIDSRDTVYAISINAEDIRSNEYFGVMFEPLGDCIHSALFFDADVSGKGMDPTAIKKNLISNGNFRLDNGRIVNFDFLKAVSNTIKIFNFDEIPFSKSNSVFRIENGRFYFDQLTISGDKADYVLNGNSSFDGELDFNVQTILSRSETNKINMPQKDLFLNNDGRMIIDLKLVGKGTDLRVAWDKDSVTQKAKEKVKKKVEQKVDEVKEEAKEEVKEKAKDLLKGLWGD
ncbi:MAG: hypothetical protein B6244_00230 [Candidatus Cloacimonetes bacterium 4572_55]|nr:MAG: hypothetical protein B6244_00230 [Candidatus Cloacimonetes bacterium 4572_55]